MLKDYYFRFNLLGTVLAITGIILFGSLGVWQLDRADEKRMLQNEIEQKTRQPAFLLNKAKTGLADKRFSRTEAIGAYDGNNELLIDNIVHNGNAGYYVMTPLLLSGGRETDRSGNNAHPVVMVNRGWIPVGRDRKKLPPLQVPAGEIRVHGQLAPPRSKPPLILGELPIEDKVWPYFDQEKFERRTGYKLLPLIIRLDANAKNGYVRDWPQYKTNVGMHIGYAIQWFVFALIVVATYLGLNIKKRAR